ncbi:MAG TPA: hypothetical protein VJI52_00495 [Candidatus Nanoarchaeia archaeon]|nr:hypothetical protein [Candidatus Nanoarchaeia archaeon]
MKKAQTEILGLAIVVVLVIIATILVVKFGFSKSTNSRNDFTSSQEASNLLNTFLRTSAPDCSKLTMTELLQDCAQGTGLVCSNGEDSCGYANSAATAILSGTLGAEKKKYEFLACSNFNIKEIRCYDSSPLVSIGQPCPGQKKLKIFPIPINPGTIYVKLEICT